MTARMVAIYGRCRVSALALCLLPAVAAAQAAPMARAFRDDARDTGKNLVAAAEAMPADRYSFRPTPAQRSFAEIVAHSAQANDYLCGTIGGIEPPQRTKVSPGDGKAVLVGRLRESLEFCDRALRGLDDSRLGEERPFLGGKRTRAAIMTHAIADWESHYSQAAMYLRLNGKLPPGPR